MSVGTTAPRRPRGETKVDIADAAARLFATSDPDSVSMAEIGQQAGVSAAAIYRHYPSKEAVLDAVLLAALERWSSVADGTLDQIVTASVDLALGDPGQLTTYLRERRRATPEVAARLRETQRLLFGRWRRAILEDRPGLSDADVVMREQAVQGVLTSLVTGHHSSPMARARTAVSDALLAMLHSEPCPRLEPAVPRTSTWTPPVTRRDEISAAALALFAQRSFHQVGVADIAEAVGMAGPSLYEHVSSKSEILLDAFDRAGAIVVAGLHTAIRDARDADDAVGRIIAAYVDTAFEQADLIAVTAREGLSIPEADRPRLARRRRDNTERTAAVLLELRPERGAAETRLVARGMLSVVQSLVRVRRHHDVARAHAAHLARAFAVGSP